MRMHRDAPRTSTTAFVPYDLMEARARSGTTRRARHRKYGFRNGQVTVLAPTGTIAFMMDCDTTGVEPDIALVKYKRSSAAACSRSSTRRSPRRWRSWATTERRSRRSSPTSSKNETIEGAPAPQGRSTCRCSTARSERSQGHALDQLHGPPEDDGATQPFLSGAISKTVNMPTDCTVEDIEDAYTQAWKMGLKAIAVYRDGCKRTQPLNTVAGDQQEAGRSRDRASRSSKLERSGR
jgi:ribonucleoside-diphosphate reductase alpha chain